MRREDKARRHVAQGVRIMAGPVRAASHVLHRIVPHERKHSKALIGCALVIVGAYLGSEVRPGAWCPVFVWDAGAWLLHGFGAAPIIELLTKQGNV